jgi:hypothetical protein
VRLSRLVAMPGFESPPQLNRECVRRLGEGLGNLPVSLRAEATLQRYDRQRRHGLADVRPDRR